MKEFLLRLFYFPTCLLRMCDDSEMIGYFTEPDPCYPLSDGLGYVYRTRCPMCGQNYVRNTVDFGGRILFDDYWQELWDERPR